MKKNLWMVSAMLCMLWGEEMVAADVNPVEYPRMPEYVSTDQWNGYRRMNFKVDGHDAWIILPSREALGKPWFWTMEFPMAFLERCCAPELLKAGYCFAHIQVGNTYGSPQAQKSFRDFYDLTQRLGLARKTVLIGLSRGGLYSYRFAAENPEKVSVIYGDAPVCDINSWPKKRFKSEWENLKKLYGFRTDADAKAYPGNPISSLDKLYHGRIALIHVVRDSDDVVPPTENSDIVEKRYRAMGGEIKVIREPGEHHPHGLQDSSEVVRFILDHNQ